MQDAYEDLASPDEMVADCESASSRLNLRTIARDAFRIPAARVESVTYAAANKFAEILHLDD